MTTLSSTAATMFRLLAFRATRDELHRFSRHHLLLGLCMTWIVGVARWWEDPRASLWQQLGVGSVVYVFILALFLWLILWLMRPEHWSYFNILTFLSLTSLPGILYAIPVRHGLDLVTAQIIRLWFLAVVAGWRVALLCFYLGRSAGMSAGRIFVGTFFPLTFIVLGLSALNLEKVVFDFMGGIHPEDRSVNDSAYGVMFLISVLSFYSVIPLFICYVVLSVQAWTAKLRPKLKPEEGNRYSTVESPVEALDDDTLPHKLCVSCRASIPATAELCTKCGWAQPV
jgi:ribosomal protein L40E